MATKALADLTPTEKFILSKQKSSVAERVRLQAFRNSGLTSEDDFNSSLTPGAGKGLEPKPWCECHNRNPCPMVIELSR